MLAKVKAETERLGIKFPAVQDNDFDNWKGYGIRAWPTIVLINRQGIIRYSHIGEGAYQRTESVIKQPLADPSDRSVLSANMLENQENSRNADQKTRGY